MSGYKRKKIINGLFLIGFGVLWTLIMSLMSNDLSFSTVEMVIKVIIVAFYFIGFAVIIFGIITIINAFKGEN